MTETKIQIKQIKGDIDCSTIIENACLKCSYEIKRNADAMFYKKRHNRKYSRGWTYGMKNGKDGRYGEVYNRTEPQLSHLLEFGHLTRYKHGKYGELRNWIPPQKHITPAYNKVKKEFLKDCENVKIKWKTEKG